MTDPVKKGLWLARTHYRMRMASFAMVFAASYLHLSGKGASGIAVAQPHRCGEALTKAGRGQF